MPSIPLPSLDKITLDPAGIGVWPHLLAAEKHALQTSESQSAKYQDTLIGVRVLGFFLKDAYEHSREREVEFMWSAYTRLLKEVSRCMVVDEDNVETDTLDFEDAYARLFKLGLHYRNHLMRVFRPDGGSLPSPSESTHAPNSPPSFDKAKDEIIQSLAKPNPTKTDVKKQALLRDGHRCTITKYYDMNSITQYHELEAEVVDNGYDFTKTECAYIFSDLESARGILEIFGLDDVDLVQTLLGGGVNQLPNVLTMSMTLHEMFDRAEFWLEEVRGQPNSYDLCFAKGYYARIVELRDIPNPKRVSFHVDEQIIARCEAKSIEPPPLPDDRLLAIRASCARVANSAGVVELADRVREDREGMGVLDEGGGGCGAELLASLLLQSGAYVDSIAIANGLGS